MKTPEEWKAEFSRKLNTSWNEDVKSIQADALRHAAVMIKSHDRCTLRSIRLRWAKRFELEATKLEEQ